MTLIGLMRFLLSGAIAILIPASPKAAKFWAAREASQETGSIGSLQLLLAKPNPPLVALHFQLEAQPEDT